MSPSAQHRQNGFNSAKETKKESHLQMFDAPTKTGLMQQTSTENNMYIMWKPDYSPKLSFIFIVSLKFQTSEWTWKKTQISFVSLFWRRQTVCCLSFCGLVTLQTDKYSFVNDKRHSCSRGVCWTMVWAKYWKVQQILIEPFARVTRQISTRVSQLVRSPYVERRAETQTLTIYQ